MVVKDCLTDNQIINIGGIHMEHHGITLGEYKARIRDIEEIISESNGRVVEYCNLVKDTSDKAVLIEGIINKHTDMIEYCNKLITENDIDITREGVSKLIKDGIKLVRETSSTLAEWLEI